MCLCCSGLQSVADARANILSRHSSASLRMLHSVLQHDAVRCTALHCIAVCCSVLQCVAVCCSAKESTIVPPFRKLGGLAVGDSSLLRYSWGVH